jgi:membrane-bound ClpP family serine protease
MLLLLDANGALLLAAFGLVLICAEFCLPGWVLPGVAGGVCLICGAYRLSLLAAQPLPAAAIVLAVSLTVAAGYGWLPPALGWLAIALLPWLCRALIPGAVHWFTAFVAALAPAVAFLLLRIAARAVSNKTLLE